MALTWAANSGADAATSTRFEKLLWDGDRHPVREIGIAPVVVGPQRRDCRHHERYHHEGDRESRQQYHEPTTHLLHLLELPMAIVAPGPLVALEARGVVEVVGGLGVPSDPRRRGPVELRSL